MDDKKSGEDGSVSNSGFGFFNASFSRLKKSTSSIGQEGSDAPEGRRDLDNGETKSQEGISKQKPAVDSNLASLGSTLLEGNEMKVAPPNEAACGASSDIEFCRNLRQGACMMKRV
mmetsp:Transcript_17799/g.29490  ORF Transcript_17799/g.29490 Transcript_17799/m.29490 type:complete len:116 (-) Transcript_17799:99-446(-)